MFDKITDFLNETYAECKRPSTWYSSFLIYILLFLGIFFCGWMMVVIADWMYPYYNKEVELTWISFSLMFPAWVFFNFFLLGEIVVAISLLWAFMGTGVLVLSAVTRPILNWLEHYEERKEEKKNETH